MPADTKEGAVARIHRALAGSHHHSDIPGSLQGALSAARSARQRAQQAGHTAGAQPGYLAQSPARSATGSTERPISIQRQSS